VNYQAVLPTNREGIDYFKTEDIVQKWGENNILYWTNVNLYSYAIHNPYIINYFLNKNGTSLKEVDHIKEFSNAIQFILSSIFLINSTVLNAVVTYKTGIHIRTGDKQIYNKENEELYREYITDIFERVSKKLHTDTEVFISSDCMLSYDIAGRYFKNFKHFQGSIIHTSDEKRITPEGLNKVLIDLLTLCKCTDSLYTGWHSNFSRIASLYNPSREFVSYEYENDPQCMKEWELDTLFSYFSWGTHT
jgi:hypothetical protein